MLVVFPLIFVAGTKLIYSNNFVAPLSLEPENGIIFSKDGIYSTLKGKAVSDNEYDNSKKLYMLLKMRALSDLNDLYNNAQDVILSL